MNTDTIKPSLNHLISAPGLSRLADADLDQLLMIRHFEWALLDLFARGAVHGTTHTCLGQEYVPVALRPLLGPDDYVFSNHRGHGHYLARHDDPAGLLAEITGRAGAVCNGVGGSQHILRDRYLSTGVQGESLLVAAGVAVHLAASDTDALACAYIGDGTWGEGAVYEALNIAALWRLPVAVFVENNGIAQSTTTVRQMAGTVAARAAAFGVRHHRIRWLDVNRIRVELGPLLAYARRRREPLVIEFVTQRLGPHSKGDDSRTPQEIDRARQSDWYALYREQHPDQFGPADERQRARVAEVVAEVLQRPAAVWEAQR